MSLTTVYNKKNIVKIDSELKKATEPFSNDSLKEPLLNTVFNNDYVPRTIVKWFCCFFGSDICFFTPTNNICSHDCPSHRSLIPIQRFKNKKLKLKSNGLPTTFHLFSYIKREMREKKEIRQKRDRRNKNLNPTISTSNSHNF
jgi:hypothetical protein